VNDPQTELSDLGEFGLIKRLETKFSSDLPGQFTGIGDDCSIIPLSEGRLQLITTDLLIENIHFLTEKITAKELGFKSLAVNLSDIAAMGGVPESAYLSIGFPGELKVNWIDDFFDGILQLCKSSNVKLMGGDTTRSRQIVINFCVTGSVKSHHVKRRDHAKPGDIVCITDTLGDSGAGLKILLENKELDEDSYYLIKKHNKPRPHLEEGKWLGQKPEVNAMIDVSDGIESDLRRIMDSSGFGSEIDLDQVPVSGKLLSVAQKYSWNPIDLALTGGEDYCLMCTVEASKVDQLAQNFEQEFSCKLFQVGRIIEENALYFTHKGQRVDYKMQGFDHFRSQG